MSDELEPTPFYRGTLPYRALRYLTRPILRKVEHEKLHKKYRHNSFSGTFDWDWTRTNFNRIALVNLLVSRRPGCAYLEIGCDRNELFDSVPIDNKVGVDPARGGTIRATSDEFFSTNTSRFDVIFIDGLHTYEQVRKDVMNSIKALKPGGWVALHDMLPRTWLEHHVPILDPGSWTGDVWKVAFELARTEGIDFRILSIDYGVGVFRLTKENPTLANLTSELMDKQFAYFYNNVHRLPIIDWADAQDWLRR